MHTFFQPAIKPASLLFLFPFLAASISINCRDIRVDGTKFNLNPLDGPHTVYTVEETENHIKNTTFTLDICRPLEKTKGVAKEEDCPNNTRVCAIERLTNKVENQTTIADTVTIAGEFSHSSGGALDPKWTRLKGSSSSADREKEGIRLEMHGGKHEGKKQRAIVEFLCLPDETDQRRGIFIADDEEPKHEEEEFDDEHGGSIKFLGWDEEKDVKTLRLEWKTKYACEGAEDQQSSKGGWGFFTWLILIVFMGVAAYLIFGSWLNYNRYSARGWDLVPHSETIRDIPYILKDWIRSVINTIQGPGSRGGYSAV